MDAGPSLIKAPLETFPLCLCSLQFVSLFARAVNICSVRDVKSTKLFSEYEVVVAFVCVVTLLGHRSLPPVFVLS